MIFISYANKVYVSDGYTKRHITSPTHLNELHAAAGKPTIQPVSKTTFDSLPDYIPTSKVLADIERCDARVETLRRIVVDWIAGS